RDLADAEAELARRQAARPKAMSPHERAAILALGDDLGQVWDAPTTTDEDTIDLIRRLAVHYPDAVIAGILNRQGRRTARGLSYTASRVQSLRYHWHIPCHQPSDQTPEGDLLN